MRAVTIREGELVIEEHPDPVPGKGEVLVRVRAAGLNGADMHQRRGLYPAPPGWPQDIPGMELAGEVAAVGDGAERFAVGDRVMATVRREELRRPVQELGAEAIPPEGFAEHGPFDVILELVGSPNLAENLMALATGGRITVIGTGAGAKAELNLLALMGKRARIHGSTLRSRSLEDKAEIARRVEREVLPLFESGSLRVPIADTFGLEQATAAYERFEAGGKLGKIVLTA